MSENDLPEIREEVASSEKTVTNDQSAIVLPDSVPESGFAKLALLDEVQQAIKLSGYTTPTSIQSQIIPHMLDGRDVLAQSQTGTGKTAAFALPILSRIDFQQRKPQVLILTPTRELAIQVAKSFATYAACLQQLKVATIYGGQSYEPQLRQLTSGVQIVVGTPGRVIDHINRGTLDISQINCLVLDEADEMLNMGFLEDVQFVLEKMPAQRQIALFSATLPGPIRTIAEQYLNDPVKITVKQKTMTADSIQQRALLVPAHEKEHALCRFLESEETDGVIVFTKTKAATITLAENLCKAGLSAVALNGDMPQATRERTVEQFKAGRLDILVATDVAARGLDVSRVSHVFNFDPPHDAESYIHRVGRTGRAGRTGKAIIFLTHSQRGKLRMIERATKQEIEIVQLPTTADINALRIKRFKQQINDAAATEDLTIFKDLIGSHAEETGQSFEIIAAALAHIAQQGRPFFAKERPDRDSRQRKNSKPRKQFESDGSGDSSGRRRQNGHRKPRQLGPPAGGMERYRIELGRVDGVLPRNIVGAVANEAGLNGADIGPIQIYDTYTILDLPREMPGDVYQSLCRIRIIGKPMQLTLARKADGGRAARPNRHSQDPRPGKSRKFHSDGSGAKARQPGGKRKAKSLGKPKHPKSPKTPAWQ